MDDHLVIENPIACLWRTGILGSVRHDVKRQSSFYILLFAFVFIVLVILYLKLL